MEHSHALHLSSSSSFRGRRDLLDPARTPPVEGSCFGLSPLECKREPRHRESSMRGARLWRTRRPRRSTGTNTKLPCSVLAQSGPVSAASAAFRKISPIPSTFRYLGRMQRGRLAYISGPSIRREVKRWCPRLMEQQRESHPWQPQGFRGQEILRHAQDEKSQPCGCSFSTIFVPGAFPGDQISDGGSTGARDRMFVGLDFRA